MRDPSTDRRYIDVDVSRFESEEGKAALVRLARAYAKRGFARSLPGRTTPSHHGCELRFAALDERDRDEIVALLEACGVPAGRPFAKGSSWRVPVYGKNPVRRLLETFDAYGFERIRDPSTTRKARFSNAGAKPARGSTTPRARKARFSSAGATRSPGPSSPKERARAASPKLALDAAELAPDARLGMLVVLGRDPLRTQAWWARCDCGATFRTGASQLLKQRSCGCRGRRR